MDFSDEGLYVEITDGEGTTRRTIDRNGIPHATVLTASYGYLEGGLTSRGQSLGVYLGPTPESRKAFVVHQMDPDTGSYDEDKLMLGFQSEAEARETYLAHYPEAFFGGIESFSIPEIRTLVLKKPGRKITRDRLSNMRPGVAKGTRAKEAVTP